MKRVLHVLNSLERSGMETMLVSSADQWAQHGFECDIVATAKTPGPLASELSQRGYRVHHIPFLRSARLVPSFQFIKAFYRLCKSGYDVVHIHTEAAPPVFAFLAKAAGVTRIAVTPHNTFRFEGVLRARKKFERRIVRLLGGRYGMISEGVKDCEWERFRNYGVRIWNWLDTERFRPPSPEERIVSRTALGLTDSDFVVTSVGNCNGVKNHPALLEAIRRLDAQMRPFYIHAGREEPDYPERELAATLGLSDRTRFLGSVGDVRPILWASDVLAMPSIREGMPISALEGAASGVPLVCSRIAGLLDVAAETKWTVLTGVDPDSIAQGLAEMASLSAEERISRGRADSELIRKRFSVANGVQSIVDGLYSPHARPNPSAVQARVAG